MGETEGGKGARIVRAAGQALTALWLAAMPAAAMDWSIVTRPGMPGLLSDITIVHIAGTGDIEGDDAARLAVLVAEHRAAGNRLDPNPTVYFDSPGGDPLVGVEIALAIRKLGLDTFVPEGAVCASACTIAFLGGVQRRVRGDFAIHAIGVRPGADFSGGAGAEDPNARTDAVQAVARFLLMASRELIGDTRMVETSLEIAHNDIGLVGDDLLRDWGVITHAMRPGQQLQVTDGTLARCGQTDWLGETTANSFARIAICDSLTATRQHAEISALAAALAAEGVEGIEAEQERFEAAWQNCGKDRLPKGLDRLLPLPHDFFSELDLCISAVVGARHAELKALSDYRAVIAAEPARSGWKTAP